MSNQLPYRYSCWTLAGDWRRGHVILAANIDTIPCPPPRHQAVVMVDGLWGEHEWTLYPQPYHHESPYLAWLRLHQRTLPLTSFQALFTKRCGRPIPVN